MFMTGYIGHGHSHDTTYMWPTCHHYGLIQLCFTVITDFWAIICGKQFNLSIVPKLG